MAFYVSTEPKNTIISLEVTVRQGRSTAFIQLKNAEDAARVSTALRSASQPMELVATSSEAGGCTLVLSGNMPENTILSQLHAGGFLLKKQLYIPPTNPWVVRSLLGFVGQTLQLTSSYMRPSGKVDRETRAFAVSNLLANTINLVYREQELDDPHQLRKLKTDINAMLKPAMLAGEQAINVDDSRLLARGNTPSQIGAASTANNFLKRHSVTVGEIGLRYFGAFGLAYPPKLWGKEGKAVTLNPSSLRAYTGVSSIIGKTVALTSAVPDPYNPKPVGWLHGLREKYSFIAGGLIEITSYAALAYDCLVNTKPDAKGASHGIVFRGKTYRDWLGATGAGMFVMGYVARLWASYGKRHVNMPELYAHISDHLAQVPSDQVPDLLIKIANNLHQHFIKDKLHQHSTGEIFSAIAKDLQEHHGIVIASISSKNTLKYNDIPTDDTAPTLPKSTVNATSHHEMMVPNAIETHTR